MLITASGECRHHLEIIDQLVIYLMSNILIAALFLSYYLSCPLNIARNTHASTVMTDIYLMHEGRREGPYSEDEIQQALAWGFISSDLLAWKDGMNEWTKVGWLMDWPERSDLWKTTRK